MDIKERDKLVMSVENLIHSIACKYRTKDSHDYEDIVQQGFIGAINATKMFNKDLGYKFNTYAYYEIRNSITSYIKHTSGLFNLLLKGTGNPFSKIYFNLSKMEASRPSDITHAMCIKLAEEIGVAVEDVVDYINLTFLKQHDDTEHSSNSINEDLHEIARLDNILNTKFKSRDIEAFRDTLEGYDHPEVAKKFRMSRQWVTLTIGKIKKELSK